MMVLITYDVSLEDANGPRRLRQLAKICLDYGVRVQYSVFECDIDAAQWVVLRQKLLTTYDERVDSLRFYRLGKGWRDKVEHHGAKPALDIFGDTLIV
ncbi:CRISPR-associated endonuclease Cas2 [Dickeya dianthicola]|uniref:CRISPR-associated endoribonuclease Cas2 n=2 Tax=Dickeya TaxID=204037 RepID=A0AAX1C7K9_9GAMM|nr:MULTISPECIES: CRISPR-associated endonuclease Cas2 [Dickeya]ATO32432.1 CRISPR-associated protein Cas2 [Dickeya dianthicola RNS04.9]MBT1431605.1 CRISPR-associated endonuclease Cas2 [Dickeya dianthicola]MBT1433090.1 CRISPR-associated endonuclease Cas2 [Dickeya dianthicola]MBX9446940.1 CRISPR-associated endonuclease Cas2 [Dickeya chrysanthemi]MCA7002985.1 CRISPR-associated endonuclease Cas2 [Dickeya dianthicola]